MESLSGLSVLVCDDERDLCDLMTSLLEGHGATVTKAYNGEEAWKALCEKRFDAVISDIRMPKLDGIGLLKRIQEQIKYKTSVILISAYTDISRSEATRLGAKKIVSKPFEIQEIIDELEKMVRSGVESDKV